MMPTVSLGEIAEIDSGGVFPNAYQGILSGDLPFAKVADISLALASGLHVISSARNYVSMQTAVTLGSAPFPANTIVFAKIGEAIRLNNRAITARPMLFDNNVMGITPRSGVDVRYLFYCLATIDFYPLANTTAVPSLRKSDIADLTIPFPSLSEQRELATLLDKANHLRLMRRYALQLCDELLPAAFVEMFGQLTTNELKWSFSQLQNNSAIASGIAKGQKYGNRTTIEVPYLRVANVQDGYLDLTEIKAIRALPEDVEVLRLQPGDIVMTEGGDFDKLGRGAIWTGGPKDCIHQNHIFRVRLDQSVLLPAFFASFLRSRFGKNYFLRCSKQTTNLASINMTQLRATPVPLPPLVLQNKFAKLVDRVQRLRAVHIEAIRQADHLFKTLLHQCFSER